MTQFYPLVKTVHIAMVYCTLALFTLRGLGSIAGYKWPQARPLRVTSYVVDTILLLAAVLLFVTLPHGVFANGWLTMKIALLVVYILLGLVAIRHGKSRSMKALFFIAALLVFAWIYSIARAHHPLGALRGLIG